MTSTGERVHAAALELFAERGFHGTGIRQLAEHAGLSSATLYHYMGTKEDLLVTLMRTSLERLVRAGEEIAGSTDDAPTRLADLVGMHVTSHAQRPLETRVVDDEVHALSPSRRQEVVALRDRYEALWQQVIDDGVGSGHFAVTSASIARRALLEMCSGVARWYDPAGRMGLGELAEEYSALALRLLGVVGDPATTPARRVAPDTPGPV
ncbi:HTH-type transcriptional repressor KstR2 [Nocardioides dokdonensis FR1436]|uniref:HTH-type transcriptional repressor KstR2 n=1 Tax=Nocardioides dokdonensis FR1436 TaxID=1300347 RepID=A0A1A9GQ30_9ACTN|nr:TetR/AcrR family transcriptional regulator [Nocardioides dokdonensis]ANH39703.1 HTH-type transcriptional repressor KstR2 [Nocardioides dokdonensis FR1436]